jgi:hypothetical protein
MLIPCPVCRQLPVFQLRTGRHGRVERLACETCGRTTPWLLTARNGEHRAELLHLWDRETATATAS